MLFSFNMSSFYYGLLQYTGPGDFQKKFSKEMPEPGTPQIVSSTTRDSQKSRKGLYPMDSEIFQSVQKLPFTLAKTNLELAKLNRAVKLQSEYITNQGLAGAPNRNPNSV